MIEVKSGVGEELVIYVVETTSLQVWQFRGISLSQTAIPGENNGKGNH